jgi:hypothetical protein
MHPNDFAMLKLAASHTKGAPVATLAQPIDAAFPFPVLPISDTRRRRSLPNASRSLVRAWRRKPGSGYAMPFDFYADGDSRNRHGVLSFA